MPDAEVGQVAPVQSLTLIRPDDWHLHLRDGAAMASVLPHTAHQFGRAIIMPNLRPPVTTVEQARLYRNRILAALDGGPAAETKFQPLMTLYLTDNTSPDEIKRAHDSGFVQAIKLYPAGATTNSDAGVTDLHKCFATLEMMQKLGMPFLVHGEVTDPEIDLFDREAVFIERVLTPLRRNLPELKIVFEHITTREAADFVTESDPFVGATITAHHLLFNRNELFKGGIKPHFYCLPVLKRESHRQALMAAAVSGNPRFFLGTDSAPHAKGLKEHSCGCAGCYTAFHAIELYAQAFENAGALDRFESFASRNGPAFYGLPVNTDTVTLHRKRWQIPAELPFGETSIVPLQAGEWLDWALV